MENSATPAPISNPGRTKLLVLLSVLLCGVSVWMMRDAWEIIVGVGLKDEQSSQILVVPVAVALLLLARRQRFRTLTVRPSWMGPVIMSCSVALWAWGVRHNVHSLLYLGPITMVVGSLVTMLGTDILRKFAPAFAVLIFLIPIPARVHHGLAVPMQDLGASVSFSVAEVLGLNVSQAGRTLRINGQDVTVAEACSGMRMIFTLFLACYMSVFTLPLKWWYRVLVLLMTPAVAIVANVIRIVLTLWAYNNFDPATADRLHTVAGWAMVLIAFFTMEGIARFVQWLGIPVLIRPSGCRGRAAASPPGGAVIPNPA